MSISMSKVSLCISLFWRQDHYTNWYSYNLSDSGLIRPTVYIAVPRGVMLDRGPLGSDHPLHVFGVVLQASDEVRRSQLSNTNSVHRGKQRELVLHVLFF